MNDLLSLVVQSKKALQHAESICSKAIITSQHSTRLAVTVLSNDAKLNWMADGVQDQLQLADALANDMEQTQRRLQTNASNWDRLRAARSHRLDSLLEGLSYCVVPASLYHLASSSSLFGSQHSEQKEPNQANTSVAILAGSDEIGRNSPVQRITTNSQHAYSSAIRSSSEGVPIKTLRDFVNERDIDSAVERMDADRNTLEDLINRALSHSEYIFQHISFVNSSLPPPLDLSPFSPNPPEHPVSIPLTLQQTTISPSTSPSSPATIRKPLSIPPYGRIPYGETIASSGGKSISPRGSAFLASPPRIPMGSSPLHTANVKRPMEALSAFLRPLVARQEEVSVTMGVHLQSLVDHYEQISGALRDYGQRNDEVNNINETVLQYERSGAVHPPSALLEGGFGLSDEDLEMFRKDTEELPAIISDIEMSAEEIDLIGQRLRAIHSASSESLGKFHSILVMLEDLGTRMKGMLEEQRHIENNCAIIHAELSSHLTALDELAQTYQSYRLAYNKLLVEMDRRRQHREYMEVVVNDLAQRLEQLRDEEISLREQFFIEQGPFLPEDICPYVADLPAKWILNPDGDETIPDIEENDLIEARKDISTVEDIGRSQ